MAIHPSLDLLITGARDSTARVWDIRTKACVHILASHGNTVSVIKA
jgi:pleiotropic regulator 1